jgi:magnesium transporter
MMERLQKTGIRMTEDDKEMLDDVIIENRQAIEMANIYSNILSGMMDAFASVINNNLTLVMKLLTSVTIILMIPTFVSSTFGMNVPLPFQNSPHAFLIVTGISLMLSLTGVIIFWKRRWF